MMRHFWILLIEILVLAFDAFKGIGISAGSTTTGLQTTGTRQGELDDWSTTTPPQTTDPQTTGQETTAVEFPPPSAVRLIPIDTTTLRLVWSSPSITNQTLLGFYITWDFNKVFVENSSTAFDITNLPTPGRSYTANICAYYASQRFREFIKVSSNTFPSPASSISVSLRQTNRLVLNWTNEGVADRCFVWVQEAALATTSCFTGSKTAIIADLPSPGKQYTIYFMTMSGQMTSATSNITERTGPFELHLNATPRSSNSALITWTLSNVTGTVPEAIYNLTITDTRDPTIVIHEYVAGFYNRSVVISGLDKYWNYSVAIVAFILDENKEELATDGLKFDYFQTLQSTPGQLQSFDVRSLSDEQRCNTCELTWEAPIEKELNGIITNYVIRWQQVGGIDRGSTEVPGDWRKRTVRVLPEDQQYDFKIQAKTQAGEGVATIKTLMSTGNCVPTTVQNVNSILVTTGSDDNNDLSTANSFVVTYDLSFFIDNKNGNITNSGLLVREVPDQENITGAPENGNECLYSSALTWSEAITRRRIPEYLATGENWLADSKNVTRKKRSILQQFVVGDDDSCSKDIDVNCNGPLPADRKYQVRAIACTRSGCHKTEYSSDIKMTKKSSSSKGWIAAAVLVPIIVCIIAGVLIYIFIIKPRRKNASNYILPMR